ncbi:MAG: DUF1893 domain-containing protein [Clostridia bacterium]|nr:DUF1893 domain-containing protein [Clostridia bacterium]
MTSADLIAAKDNLAGHTLCLSKDGVLILDDKRGITPLLELIASGKDVSGYSAADKVVGKAAAALFIKCGVKQLYAAVLSKGGAKLLESHGVEYVYDTLTDAIINRAGTDACPMEKAVRDIEEIEDMYVAILREHARINKL